MRVSILSFPQGGNGLYPVRHQKKEKITRAQKKAPYKQTMKACQQGA